MKTSNIFAYIELSKLIDELSNVSSSEKLKEKLKTQSAYFNILESRYFSDSLANEWEGIVDFTRKKGAKVDEEGRVIANAIPNTIESLTVIECQRLVDQVYVLYEKVKKELF